MKREDTERSQQGTGSSENKGESREAQKNQMTSINREERKDIALEGGLGRKRISDLNEMGALSGRDDKAGSDKGDMSDQNTSQPTR